MNSESSLAAIGFIAGCLSVRSTPDSDEHLRNIITSGRINWRTIINVAETQQVTPALWVGLRNKNLAENLPSQVRDYFWKAHLLNLLKNKRLREQALEAVAHLNAIGIRPMLLKGGISLFVKTFDDPGMRVMVDLDILVPRSEARACWDSLRTLGYIPIDIDHDYSCHHHLRPLYRPGDYGAIEIHREALLGEAATLLPSELIWRTAEPISESGAAMSIPAPTCRILHNLLHSTLMNRAHARGEVALRSLHELALTQRLHAHRIDWTAIRQIMARGGKSRVLNAWVYGAHRWFGSPLPDGMRPTLGAMAHGARTRLQARWSWTQEIIDRCMWFSAPDICERYRCNDDFVSLMGGRMRLATHLACKYSIWAFYWLCRKFVIRQG